MANLRLLIASLAVAFSSPALATPILYDVKFDVHNSADFTEGTGSFIWHDDTHVLSDFMWDFEGRIGGFSNPWAGWQGEYLFMMMTGSCWEEPTAPCLLGGIGSSSLFGWPIEPDGFAGSIGTITTSYFQFNSPGGSVRAFYTTTPRSVPEPGTLLLLSSAIAGVTLTRRRRAK